MGRANGEVDGEGVAIGDGHELRGVEGVDVEDGEIEEDAELGSECGEVLVDELQLERMPRRLGVHRTPPSSARPCSPSPSSVLPRVGLACQLFV